MPPKRTSARTAAAVAAKAAPAVNGTATTTTAANKKRKAAAEETNGVATKKAKNFDTALEDLDINDTKRPTTTKKAAAAKPEPKPKPAAKKAAAKPAAKPAAAKSATKAQTTTKPAAKPVETAPFSAEPATTLIDFKNSPPDASSLPVINETPSQVLTVYVFGTGDMSGDLGLGPNKKLAKRATVIPTLDPNQGTYRVVQLDCGGMHTVALTDDSKIVTWGGNDLGALGRDSNWDGGLRDMDEEAAKDDSDSDDEALNPLESTPTHIPQDSFPPGTEFCCVAAGDSCSFAVTTTGLVYGWGTFQVSLLVPPPLGSHCYNTTTDTAQ